MARRKATISNSPSTARSRAGKAAKKTVAKKKARPAAAKTGTRAKAKTAVAKKKAAKNSAAPKKTAPKKKVQPKTVEKDAARAGAATKAQANPASANPSSKISTSKSKKVSAKAKRAATTKAVAPTPRRTPPRSSPLSKELAAAQQFEVRVVDEDRKLPKTKLTRKQLKEFRELLLAKRRELVGNVGNLTDEALGRNRREAAGDLSAMPIHMADLGSDNWEQEFTLGLIANERKLLREIDAALARIEDRTYGICLATHNPISPERLRAKPWAKYCIEYARAREAGRVS